MPSAVKFERFPLIGQVTQRDTQAAVVYIGADQYFRNAHFELFENKVTGKRSVYARPREILNSSGSPSGVSTTHGEAIIEWTGNANAIVSSFSATNSTIYVGNSSIGAITGKAFFIRETDISGTPNLLINHATRGYFFPLAGSLTEITDVDFPPKQTPALTLTGPFVPKDGFAFIMTTNGQIWNADLNSLSGWTATSFTTAQEKPDAGIGLARLGDDIIAFGKSSTEFFQNAGYAVGSPLSGVKGATLNFGCPNQFGYCNVNNTVAFVGTGDKNGVFMFQGRTPVKISNSVIDRWIIATGYTGVRLNPWVSYGKIGLLLTVDPSVGTSTAGYHYDFELGIWSVYDFSELPEPNIIQSAILSSGNMAAVGDYTSGRYFVSSTGSVGLTSTIVTNKFDGGTSRRKFLREIDLFAEVTVATTNVSISWTDNDATSYTTPRVVTIGFTLPASDLGRLTRCGSFRRRQFKITWSGTNGDRLEALGLTYRVGAI